MADPEKSVGEKFREIIELAAENPDGFVDQVSVELQNARVQIEDVYTKYRQNPEGAKRAVRNATIRSFASLLRRELK